MSLISETLTQGFYWIIECVINKSYYQQTKTQTHSGRGKEHCRATPSPGITKCLPFPPFHLFTFIYMHCKQLAVFIKNRGEIMLLTWWCTDWCAPIKMQRFYRSLWGIQKMSLYSLLSSSSQSRHLLLCFYACLSINIILLSHSSLTSSPSLRRFIILFSPLLSTLLQPSYIFLFIHGSGLASLHFPVSS
jgi:hypothetical protein